MSMAKKRLAVINVVGLTRALLARFPQELGFLNQFCQDAFDIEPTGPGLTCSAQTTYLTGSPVSEHGIVGNGWYFKDLNEVLLWRQSNTLVEAPSIWHRLRKQDKTLRTANTFWWYAMNTQADITLTPRPLYLADGRKLPDCYSNPLALRETLRERLGTFPLFHFWGPMTSIKSSQWIADAAVFIEKTSQPDLQLVYLPHLDYCLQKFGNKDYAALKDDLEQIDQLAKTLVKQFEESGVECVVISEYGVTNTQTVVYPNRILRKLDLLGIKVDLGKENLDFASSQAFAVADHQIAHVYIQEALPHSRKKSGLVHELKHVFSATEGIAKVLDKQAQQALGLAHDRSGDLLLISEPDSWFAYYFWESDDAAPDYARTVDIHRKPGYDPCEMFFNQDLVAPKLSAAAKLLKKKLGFRTVMDLISLDPNLVKGSHGAIPSLMEKPSADMYPLIAGNAIRESLQSHADLESQKILATSVQTILASYLST